MPAYVPLQWCGCGDEVDFYGDHLLGLCWVCAEDPDRVQRATERRDGPRYVEAVRGARAMRERAFWQMPLRAGTPNWHPQRAFSFEREGGIPWLWITRP